MVSLRWNGTPRDFDVLEAAVCRVVGPCRCGPLRRRMGYLCNSCECLAGLLSTTDTRTGKPTLDVWSIWRECPEILRLREPVR